MATTNASNVADQTPELWSTDLLSQAEKQTFWHRFEGGEGSSMPVVRKDDLTKSAGDTIHTDIALALTGAGITADTSALSGNEEALKFRQTDVTVGELTHAVQWTKKASILNIHDLRSTALRQLSKWLAGKLDDALFNELTGSGTTLPTSAVWYAGDATDDDTVVDSDNILTLDVISEVKAYAQTNNYIEPVRLDDGEEIFGLVVHPYAALQLKKNSSWQQAQREAGLRGNDNPLFKGALGMWDGVVLYPSTRVPWEDNAAATPNKIARNIFFGANAVSRAFAYYPDWTEEESDYGRKTGVATYTIKGEKLNVFDLTSGGGAAAADYTAIGAMNIVSYAPAPTA